jgi:hypothetical protein
MPNVVRAMTCSMDINFRWPVPVPVIAFKSR